jgi:branched-chain amino acid transport system permease protein
MSDTDRIDVSSLNQKLGEAYASLRHIGRARAITFSVLLGVVVVFSIWAIATEGWDLFAQRVVDGATNGFIYAAMALALVLIYKATTVVNFAQGEMAMFGTFIAYVIFHDWGWPVGVAIPLAMLISGILAAGLERVLIRPFDPSNHLAITIATLSLFLILNGLAGVIWGFDGKGFPSPFPLRNERFDLLGAQVEWTKAFIALTVIVAVILVTLLLNTTKIGLAFRALSSNLESSRLVGVHSGRTIQFGWALAAAMGTLAGCLFAQTTAIEPNFMGRLLVFSFAAATLGGLDSLGGAVAGGLIVGLVQTMAGGYIDFVGTELATGTALLVIVVILMVKPTGLFGSKKVERV